MTTRVQKKRKQTGIIDVVEKDVPISTTPPKEKQWKFPPDLPSSRIPRRALQAYGNINHGRPLNDPVYKTFIPPKSLQVQYPISWRNGGRGLLTFAMAALEGIRRIWTQGEAVRWQMQGPCGERCKGTCSKSIWRCLCAWRGQSGFNKHLINMDRLINTEKTGIIKNETSLACPQPRAIKNETVCTPMIWDSSSKQYKYVFQDDPAINNVIKIPITRDACV